MDMAEFECPVCEGVYMIEDKCEDGRCEHCNDGGVDNDLAMPPYSVITRNIGTEIDNIVTKAYNNRLVEVDLDRAFIANHVGIAKGSCISGIYKTEQNGDHLLIVVGRVGYMLYDGVKRNADDIIPLMFPE